MLFPTPCPFLHEGSRVIKTETAFAIKNPQNCLFQSHSDLTQFLEQRTFSLTKEQQQQQILPWNKVVVLPSVTHFQHKILAKDVPLL